MSYFIQLNKLHKSVWSFINKGIACFADCLIVPPGCCLWERGYAGFYTPDLEIWAIIHAIRDVNKDKLSQATGCPITIAKLQKMVKDIICSDNYFPCTPNIIDTTSEAYQIPILAHYDGVLSAHSVAEWLQNKVQLSLYMVHTHVCLYLHQAFEAESAPEQAHKILSIHDLSPDKRLAPAQDDHLSDFPKDHDWTPNHGPCRHLLPIASLGTGGNGNTAIPSLSPSMSTMDTTTNTLSVPPGDMANGALSNPISSPEEVNMLGSGVTPANA
jgi:hypothetical protein